MTHTLAIIQVVALVVIAAVITLGALRGRGV